MKTVSAVVIISIAAGGRRCPDSMCWTLYVILGFVAGCGEKCRVLMYLGQFLSQSVSVSVSVLY